MKTLLRTLGLLSILTVSCTGEVKYFKEEIYKIATTTDPRIEFVLANNFEGKLPNCSNYIGDCINVFGVKLGMLYFIAVEYGSNADAKKAALKYRGYYFHNWFFDDVSGEPALEEFMVKLEAKKP